MQHSDLTTIDSPVSGNIMLYTRAQLQTAIGLLMVTALILMIFQPALIYLGDAISVRYSTAEFINQGEIDVSPSIAQKFGERGQYFYKNEKSGLWYPKYGILNTFLYVPPLLMERFTEGSLKEVQEMTAGQRKSRVFYLNLYNILISLVISAYLYFIALNFGASSRVAVLYVLGCLFGTFVWNYLRAQTFEIFQLCFFLGLYYSLVRYTRLVKKGELRTTKTHFWLILFFTSLLVLEKLVFVLLVPVVLVWILWADAQTMKYDGTEFFHRFTYVLRKKLPSILLFLTGLIALIFWANWYRFGSPFTTGYGQWEKEKYFLSGNPVGGLYGYLFDPQKSIFLYFPVLFFALFRFRSFLKKYTHEFGFVLVVFLVFYIINSFFINWRGDWCYGPRYLLFVLPVLSLPVLKLFETETKFGSQLVSRILKCTLVLTLMASALCQTCVNLLAFETPYNTIDYFSRAKNENVSSYLKSPFWVINLDVLRHKMGQQVFPPLQILKPKISGESFQKHSTFINSQCTTNFLFPNDLIHTEKPSL